ncbi:hypothetical protein D3C83_39600 [compost metagenome]
MNPEAAALSGISRSPLAAASLTSAPTTDARARIRRPGPGLSPALRTSAAALPSGKGNGFSTIMVRRSGTENSTPSRPPRPAMASTQL